MKKFMWAVPLIIIVAVLGITLFSGLVMMLWNGILTPVLHVGIITIWQAAGILLLSKILFGGFGRGRRWHRHRSKMHWQHACRRDAQQYAG